ncbi:MAG: hypothetical protein LBI02_05460, partial [Opitutaceae bacterium]|nr:hypothetical protein [Opitutaceae bacterium]
MKKQNFLALLLLLMMSTAATQAETIQAELVANDSILVFVQDGSAGKLVGYKENSAEKYIGNTGSKKSMRNVNLVIGFRLPEIKGTVGGVTFNIDKTGNSSTPFKWTAQLYVFAPNVNPRAIGRSDYGAIHYAGAKEDSNADVRVLDMKFITQKTKKGPVSIDLTKGFAKGGPLADFYGADGKPLSRDGMIWFRLNQGSEPAAELQRIIVDNS